NFEPTIEIARDEHSLVEEDQHHPALSISIEVLANCMPSFPTAQNIRYNFRKANLSKLYSDLLTADWSSLDEYTDVDQCLDAFYKILYNILDNSVPKFSANNSHKYPVWFTSEIIRN